MKIIAITQARTGSTRFPNKIMNKIETYVTRNKIIESIHESKCIVGARLLGFSLTRNYSAAADIFYKADVI